MLIEELNDEVMKNHSIWMLFPAGGLNIFKLSLDGIGGQLDDFKGTCCALEIFGLTNSLQWVSILW